jgi:hypothetical protein
MKIKERLLFVDFAIAAVENEHLFNQLDRKPVAMSPWSWSRNIQVRPDHVFSSSLVLLKARHVCCTHPNSGGLQNHIGKAHQVLPTEEFAAAIDGTILTV